MTDLVWILIGLGVICFSEFRGPSLDIHTWDLFLSYSRPISRLLESYSPNEREGSDSEDGEKTYCRYSYILRGFYKDFIWFYKGFGSSWTKVCRFLPWLDLERNGSWAFGFA